MLPSPRLVVPDIRQFIRSRICGLGRQGLDGKVSFLTPLLLRSYLGKNRHDWDPESPDSSFFGSRFLREHLGGSHSDPKTGFPVYQKYLWPFWDFDRLNEDYSEASGITKTYRLRRELVSFLDSLWVNPTIEAHLIDERTQQTS